MASSGDVAAQDGFEPALGLHAIERVALVSGSSAAAEEPGDEFAQIGLVLLGERGLVGAGAEGDLVGG